MFNVYQILMTHAMADHINIVGWDEAEKTPEIKAHMKMSCFPKDVPAEFWPAYTLTMEVDAETLDEVFEYGNIGPAEKVNRFVRSPSVSVGNVIEKDGEYWLVAGFGFIDVTESIKAAKSTDA